MIILLTIGEPVGFFAEELSNLTTSVARLSSASGFAVNFTTGIVTPAGSGLAPGLSNAIRYVCPSHFGVTETVAAGLSPTSQPASRINPPNASNRPFFTSSSLPYFDDAPE